MMGRRVEEKNEYETDSMMAEIALKRHQSYEKVLEKRMEAPMNPNTAFIEENDESNFPLRSISIDFSPECSTQQEDVEDVEQTDRGLFIEGDALVDEYIAGSSTDLDPGDVMVSSRSYYGIDDAVEHISFQLPGQRASAENAANDFGDGELEPTMTGTIVEELESSKVKCTGCGANFHCKDSSLPGFVPFEIFAKIERNGKPVNDNSLCKRCHLLHEHNFLLNVNVVDVDYASMMSELRNHPESLVLLVLDVTDLPGSIYPKLAEIIGSRKPMIVIGNKVDLLPPDARTGYMYRFKKTVERAVEKAGYRESFNIIHTALVSAKTGYGVEDLITEIYMKYTNVKMGMRGNMYLVGCTNAGKSTMFNALLQSDLCKVRAVDLVDRATTSIWPGTTISLLKFPVMKPSPYKLEMRRRRLIAHRAWTKKEMFARKLLLNETGDDRFAIPTAVIQNTFKESEDGLQPMALKELSANEEDNEEKTGKPAWSLDDSIFAKGKWCYDTPGTVNENQVLSLFTLDELINAIPRKILRPRTAILRAGDSLLIGGVGRIDVEEASDNVLLTTFANEKLPLNVMPISEVDEFLTKWLGTKALVVPCGGAKRMENWPGLGDGREFRIRGNKDEGCCDIVLSSIGWVMVNSKSDLKIKAFSPDSKGLTARLQPILPNSADLRGKRIPGSRFYKYSLDSNHVVYLNDSSFFAILCLIASLGLGVAFSHWMFKSANGDMMYGWVNGGEAAASRRVVKERAENEKIRKMPWQGLDIPSSLNDSLEMFLNEIIDQYVNTWYGASISRDRAFLNEIRYQLRFATANLVRYIQRIDLAKFSATHAVPSIAFHMTRLSELERHLREKNLARSVIETNIAQKLADCHIALASREHERHYLQQITEFLIPRLLDDSRLAGRAHDDDSPLRLYGSCKVEQTWPSKSVRHFLREILTNAVLIPSIDSLTQPDMINYWLILLFDDGNAGVVPPAVDTSLVELLEGFQIDAPTNVPDSLLQLKLTEILRDSRLYAIFRMYLQDIRGPVNELQFLCEATRIHESIQRSSESASQIGYDVWQLYTQFVHESTPDRVELDKTIVTQFEEAVKSKNLKDLDVIIETSYQTVYNRMQSEHVITFCQSECFLGQLCGSPPVTINELIDRETQEKRKHQTVEKTFSLSQLRDRVRKALTSFSEDDDDNYSKNDDIPTESFDLSNSSSFVNVPSIDILTEEENKSSEEEEVMNEQEANTLIMDPDAKDLNKWKVNVSKVAPIRDSYSGRTGYVFVIEVVRPEAKEHETKRWEIHRSFSEFYALETKLNEFHGDSLRFAALPPRKAFVTRDRPFMEQHRLIFDTFISTLCKQKLLNRSELLLSFLTSNEEVRDTLLLSDLNPWKVVKKMPGKLSREKGQNLRPFLLKSLATILARDPPRSVESAKDPETTSMDFGSSINNYSLSTNAIYSSVYGNNFEGIVDFEKVRNRIIGIGEALWSHSAFDSALLFLWAFIKRHSIWLANLVSSFRSLCRHTADSAIDNILKGVFKQCLSVDKLVLLVQHLQYTIFCNDNYAWPTENEMQMREELAKRRTLEYFQNLVDARAERFIGRENVKDVVGSALEILQYPRLNKQLAYVLLDQLLVEVFAELNDSGAHPLQ
ncbi:unnamed protein product [Caenorhabditis bovis]|uniref:PXA domain-containing protein n=1 Tax=Caenorhabditis bovis TaxID=2654633 RepID=A0A8S1FFI3_9PELO|nr:unnamed protein product [Caenorhabditis bovis]